MSDVCKGFKMSEFGYVPSEWEVKHIKEVAEVVSGGTPKKNEKLFWENGEILWATPTDITKNKSKYISKTELSITQLGLEKSSATLLPPGTVLMTSRATIGECSISKTYISTNQGFKSFICKENLNNEYMYYALEFLKPYFLVNASGSTFLEISKSATENQLILVPPIKEQQKIASILSIVDEQIKKAEQLIEKVKELKIGLMQQLLIKGIGHKNFKHSIYGDIPQSWSELKLEDLVEYITYGFTNPMPTTEQGPYMVTAKDVKDGTIDYETARRTDPEKFLTDLTDKSRPNIGDILITKDGTLGRVAVVDKENICINQSVAVMRPKKEKVNINYLAVLLQSPHIQKAILAESGGSTIKHIYITKLSKTIIPYTGDIREQEKIAGILNIVDNQISSYVQEKAKFVEFKKGLVQQLMTGKIRVKVD